MLGESEADRKKVEDAVLFYSWSGALPARCRRRPQQRSAGSHIPPASQVAAPLMPRCLPHPSAGIPDYSDEWFAIYNVSSTVQATRAELTRLALSRLDHGFSPIDAAGLEGASRLRDAYDAYFLDFIETVQARLGACRPAKEAGLPRSRRRAARRPHAVQKQAPAADAPRTPSPLPLAEQSPESKALAAALTAAGPIPEEGGLASHYTIVTGSGPEDARGVPYALYFNESLPPVLDALDEWIEREPRSSRRAGWRAGLTGDRCMRPGASACTSAAAACLLTHLPPAPLPAPACRQCLPPPM